MMSFWGRPTTKDPVEALRDLVKIQKQPGNWNCNSYMHGMANGMILALAMLENREPDYLSKPDRWLDDLPPPVEGQSSLDLGPYKPGHDAIARALHDENDCHPECNCIRLPVAGGFQ
jgi:hypothetical protein